MPSLSASQNNVPIIAAIVGVLLVVLGTAIVAVVIALVVIRRKKSKQFTNSYTVDEEVKMDDFDNPTYTGGIRMTTICSKFLIFLCRNLSWSHVQSNLCWYVSSQCKYI